MLWLTYRQSETNPRTKVQQLPSQYPNHQRSLLTASLSKHGIARFNVNNNANTENLYKAVTSARDERKALEEQERRAREAREAAAAAAAQAAAAPEEAAQPEEGGGLFLSLQSSHSNQ